MTIRAVVIIGRLALLVAAVVGVAVALRNRRQMLPPDVPVSVSSAEVRVKAVERKGETIEPAGTVPRTRRDYPQARDVIP